MVFKQPLCQTQGFMRGIAGILGVEIAVLDFSTLSRRGNGVILQTSPRADKQAAIHFVVDSTGLKIFGAGEWLEEKYKTKRKRRSWRKLHLGLDLVSGEIVSSDLTTDDVGDPTALPGPLDQVDGPVDLFLAPLSDASIACRAMDGAYDGEPTSDLLAALFGSMIEVMIPPSKTAILSAIAGQDLTARDCHIASRGRMGWQKSSGYNSAATLRRRSALGRPSSGQSSRRATLEIREQRPRLASGSLTG
jgi:hypothetical protein